MISIIELRKRLNLSEDEVRLAFVLVAVLKERDGDDPELLAEVPESLRQVFTGLMNSVVNPIGQGVLRDQFANAASAVQEGIVC